MSLRKTILTVLSTVVSLSLAAPATEALTLFVDAGAPPGTNDGTSWTHAYTDLQVALGAAQSSDEIWVAQGTYKPDGGTGDRTTTFQLKTGVAIYGGFAGYGEADPDLRDITLHETILSGDIGTPGSASDNSYHVVSAIQTGTGTLLDGFTITGAYASSSPNDRNKGGGMYVSNAAVTVSNCTFSANYAGYSGGGMYRVGSANLVVAIEGCRFLNNQGGLMGGGIDFYNTQGNPDVLNCVFAGNTAGYGGGIHGLGRDMTVTNCLFSGNSGNNGGGAVKTTTGSPRLTNCTFTANTSNPDKGGALDASTSDSTPIVTNCILWDDSAPEIVGGASVFYSDVEGGWTGTGSDNINSDPLFVDTTNGDYHLLEGSPCIDAGDDTAVPADTLDLDGDGDTTEPIPYDLDGEPRVWCGAVDLGAYESTLGTGEPEITCPDPNDVSLECPADTDPNATGYAAAIDGCTGDPITVSYSDEVEAGTCPGSYVITRTWFVADDPTVACYQTITVVDTTVPVLEVPSDVTIECDQSADPANTGEASATDTCDEAPAVTYSDNVVPGSCSNEWTITRTWTATDACDNSTSADQIITVVDTTAPVLTVDSTPITVVDSDCSGDEVVTLPTATAMDNCDPSPTVTNDAPATFPAGETTTVTFTATDACGNSSRATVDVTVEHNASIRVHAATLTLGWGWRPCITSEPLVGITVGAYDYSPGSCAYDQRWCGCWFCWTYLPTIVAECTPVNTAVTDENGWATIDLPPGDYIIVSHFDSDGDGELDFYLGHRVWRHLDCGESLKTYLRMLVTARGQKLPGKFARLTGSELVIVEPEYVVWDEEEQLYPFGLEAVGDWEVSASVDPPEGFVPDYDSLATDIEDDIDALQFTITEVGSDLVPTQTTFKVLHGGRMRRVHSSVDILLTPEYARSRGFNVAELRARGLIVDDADHVWSAVESQPVTKPVPAVDRPVPQASR
jgi:hypothetical protein